MVGTIPGKHVIQVFAGHSIKMLNLLARFKSEATS
jgi:hypothetical protein